MYIIAHTCCGIQTRSKIAAVPTRGYLVSHSAAASAIWQLAPRLHSRSTGFLNKNKTWTTKKSCRHVHRYNVPTPGRHSAAAAARGTWGCLQLDQDCWFRCRRQKKTYRYVHQYRALTPGRHAAVATRGTWSCLQLA